MSPRPSRRIGGVVLQIRVQDGIALATVVVDADEPGEPARRTLLGSLDLRFVGAPGDQRYRAWTDAVQEIYAGWLRETLGEDGLFVRRVRAGSKPRRRSAE